MEGSIGLVYTIFHPDANGQSSFWLEASVEGDLWQFNPQKALL